MTEDNTVVDDTAPAEKVNCRHCGQPFDGEVPEDGDFLCPACEHHQDLMQCPTCGSQVRISLMPADMIEVVNGAGAPITATFVTQNTYPVGATTYAIADLAVTITNGTTKIIGPFDKQLFNDTNGLVQVTWSAVTTITARVLEMGTA